MFLLGSPSPLRRQPNLLSRRSIPRVEQLEPRDVPAAFFLGIHQPVSMPEPAVAHIAHRAIEIARIDSAVSAAVMRLPTMIDNVRVALARLDPVFVANVAGHLGDSHGDGPIEPFGFGPLHAALLSALLSTPNDPGHTATSEHHRPDMPETPLPTASPWLIVPESTADVRIGSVVVAVRHLGEGVAATGNAGAYGPEMSEFNPNGPGDTPNQLAADVPADATVLGLEFAGATDAGHAAHPPAMPWFADLLTPVRAASASMPFLKLRQVFVETGSWADHVTATLATALRSPWSIAAAAVVVVGPLVSRVASRRTEPVVDVPEISGPGELI